jgi:hypothetical protein
MATIRGDDCFLSRERLAGRHVKFMWIIIELEGPSDELEPLQLLLMMLSHRLPIKILISTHCYISRDS